MNICMAFNQPTDNLNFRKAKPTGGNSASLVNLWSSSLYVWVISTKKKQQIAYSDDWNYYNLIK